VIYFGTGDMRRRWQIACYIDKEDQRPVVNYMFDDTNEKDLMVMIAVIQRLSRVGQELIDTDMAKHIEGPIFELRKDRHRIFYAEDKTKGRFVLLSAFLKETQKTPIEKIEEAKNNLQDYLKAGNCEIFEVPFDDFQ
jgi:phage-related protein